MWEMWNFNTGYVIEQESFFWEWDGKGVFLWEWDGTGLVIHSCVTKGRYFMSHPVNTVKLNVFDDRKQRVNTSILGSTTPSVSDPVLSWTDFWID